MTDRFLYEPTYAEPETIEELRFWTRNEFDQISAAVTTLANESGGGGGARNFVYSEVTGTFPYQAFWTTLTTIPTITSQSGNRMKLELNLTSSNNLDVRILSSVNSGTQTLRRQFLGNGTTRIPIDWLDSTVYAQGDTISYRIDVQQPGAGGSESIDCIFWVEEA